MLGFLFRGLTAEPARGAALFETLTSEARRPHWYVQGKVPDTLDGRFAVTVELILGQAWGRAPVARPRSGSSEIRVPIERIRRR